MALLVGLHTSFLNGLLRRGEAMAAGLVEAGFPGGDLVEFLREDWAAPLAQTGFARTAALLRDSLTGAAEGAGGAADPTVGALWEMLGGLLAEGGGDAECQEAVERAVGVGGRGVGQEAKATVLAMVKCSLQTGWGL